MPSQTQIDQEYEASEIERRIAYLERKFNEFEESELGAIRAFGASGAGQMGMPPIVSTAHWHALGDVIAASSLIVSPVSATYPSADLAIFMPVKVTETITIKKLWVLNGATASGNTNMALYNSEFILVAGTETGSTAQAGTNVIQEFTITPTGITPGLYYVAIAMDNTTGTLFRYSIGSEGAKYVGLFSQASSFDLPAVATPADANSYAPVMGFSTRELVA
jgi:hypothetical protein